MRLIEDMPAHQIADGDRLLNLGNGTVIDVQTDPVVGLNGRGDVSVATGMVLIVFRDPDGAENYLLTVTDLHLTVSREL